jgi:hypothetical protein
LVANSDKHEKIRFHAILHMAVLLGLSSLWAQEVPTNTAVPLKSNYDYHDAFAPFLYKKWNNTVRKRSTGAEYWQNRADYVLTAKLNAQNNEIVGTDIITYTNNSPDTMSFIWMNLDQNLFKSDSRGNAVVPLVAMVRGEDFDGGHKIKSVKIVSSSGKSTEVEVYNYRYKNASFSARVKSKRGAVKVKIDFSYILRKKVQTELEFGY